ncbi:MAG: tetratricopeptide repeat protein [Cyanobacteria bacterium J06642_3]
MIEANSEENKSQPESRRDIKIDQGNYNQKIGGDYYDIKGDLIINPEAKPRLKKPSNLNRTGAANFVGREKQLEELHQLLQQNKQVTISAIAGMGGIGKTELALQYALAYQDKYLGSLCWFSVRGENLVTQIIEFAGTHLNIFPPKELESDTAKVNYCWRNWQSETSLIILDDVLDYGQFYREQIEPYLPPVTSQIKVLMTSRERPGNNIPRIDLDVLSEDKALELLQSFIGKSRIEAEPELAQELCVWLGYLPLGLELVGRYIALDETLTIEKTLKRLERKKLKAKALLDPQQADMNAQLGVAAAFDLSWDVLSPEVQELGCYLSLFNSEPFKWSWVEAAWIESEDEDEREDAIEDLEELRNVELTQSNLLKAVPGSQAYQIHSLIAQYLRAKLEERTQATELKQKFCVVMNQIASSISDAPILEEIEAVTIAIPHLTFVAAKLTPYIDDDNLTWSYLSLGGFYRGQGLYNQGSVWLEQCLNVCRERFGEEHPDVAISLNNLALLYQDQGRYEDAEPLYTQALELRQQLLGDQHPYVAQSLNNLAALYYAQGRHEAAEPLYNQALELRQQLLGEQHPDIAQSLNNLAALYSDQKRYEDAESFYLQALELRQQLLGEQHPDVAISLNNLAGLYSDKGRYKAAEPLYKQALAIAESVLGENHPHTKTCRDHFTYCMMKKFLQMPEAEMRQVLPEEVCEQLLQLKQQMES